MKRFFTIMNCRKLLPLLLLTVFISLSVQAQHSVARKWNEVLLTGIRNDLARPTVHARNLFHVSAAMYDAWAAYDPVATTWLLGKSQGPYSCSFSGTTASGDVVAAQEEAISYAAFRMIMHRFKFSPGRDLIFETAASLMSDLGYDTVFHSVDYSTGNPASLGNYIAKSMIEFGFVDYSNEAGVYKNQYYSPVNPPLIVEDSGNPFIIDPNHWQPLFIDTFIDQSGNEVPGGAASFLSPEWGAVVPFSLRPHNANVHERDGFDYLLYHDPGEPPHLLEDGTGTSDLYKWGFSMVSLWQSHLDPTDGVMWDISPGASGNLNIENFPTTFEELPDFYDELGGGDPGTGRALNPKTGQPYPPQIVPRGDYARVLAEFWADGPDSETPPGHWFTILNYVSDHPQFEHKYKGETVMSNLEWDIKSYFALGGAMHDVAVATWGVKGWYDYIRPISAIRFMGDQGQSSDPALPSYDPQGLPLVEGKIELVKEGDPLAGAGNENVGKIKLFTWRGHPYINDPTIDDAGVGWILSGDWWPYQRPTFVTPPFAGYTSGHSTYSRAAAELLTIITGDEFFPGGVGEFLAPQNAFLVFEEGPSVDVTLQWATYRDAADQCSLSRIWGGIHPPQDDMPGRHMGKIIGTEAAQHADKFFQGIVTTVENSGESKILAQVYPNPSIMGQKVMIELPPANNIRVDVTDIRAGMINQFNPNQPTLELDTENLTPGLYIIRIHSERYDMSAKLIVR